MPYTTQMTGDGWNHTTNGDGLGMVYGVGFTTWLKYLRIYLGKKLVIATGNQPKEQSFRAWKPATKLADSLQILAVGRFRKLKFPTCGYGSIPINTIFSGMNIHLPAILMWTTGVQGFDTLPHVINDLFAFWEDSSLPCPFPCHGSSACISSWRFCSSALSRSSLGGSLFGPWADSGFPNRGWYWIHG